MKTYKSLIKSTHLIFLISALAFTGFLSTKLMADQIKTATTKKAKKIKKQKKTKAKKTPKNIKKKKPTKKSTKPTKTTVKKEPIIKDKALVKKTEYDKILEDQDAGQWELIPRGTENEKLTLDVCAVGPDKVIYGVDKETKTLYANNGNGWEKKIEGSINFVTVAMDGAVLLLNKEGEIFTYDHKTGEREKIAGSSHEWDSIAALNSNVIWAVEYEEGKTYGKLYSFQSSRWFSNWTPVNNDEGKQTQGIKDIFITPEELWIIDMNGMTYVKDIEEWKTGILGIF